MLTKKMEAFKSIRVLEDYSYQISTVSTHMRLHTPTLKELPSQKHIINVVSRKKIQVQKRL